MATDYIESARAIESLRTGVPNTMAVSRLGCDQPKITANFELLLDRTSQGTAIGGNHSAMLIKGGFGSGKSHTLAFLENLALKQRFVTSRISINKETPLSDPDKLFRALADSAVLPDRSGIGIFEAGQQLAADTDAYRQLEHWANSQKGLDGRFGACMKLFRLARRDFEMRDQIIRFWSGDPIGVHWVKTSLRDVGAPTSGSLSIVRMRDLGRQRAEFASRMLRTVGYRGWVWLIDEVELIGSYSLLQRMRSYSEIGRMIKDDSDLNCPGVVAVLAITDDFDSAVIQGKQDLTMMPPYFAERCQWGWENPRHKPQIGMNAIQTAGILLDRVRTDEAGELYEKLRLLYRSAYPWNPPKNTTAERLSSTTIRQKIKRWVTTWDLQRLLPGVDPGVETDTFDYNYTDQELESPPERPNDEGLIDEILNMI